MFNELIPMGGAEQNNALIITFAHLSNEERRAA
jgi:hypothetical protein